MSLLDAIGLVSGALGIVSFIQGNLATSPEQGATVRIKAGLENGTEDASLAGVVVGVYGWNANNQYFGSVDGSHIAHGDFADYTIDQNVGGQRVEYIGISGGDDAICITWISISQSDNTRGAVLTGDVGAACGQYWYANVETAGYFDNDTTRPYKPNCFWLDSDHTNDIPSAAVKFGVAVFGAEVADTIANSDVCNAVLWGPDSGPINAAPIKRAVKARLPSMETQLVVSNFTGHRAEYLCSSPTSWGPDFIGSDGMYCDMGSKVLSPLCSTWDISGCIELDLDSNQLAKRTTIASREAEVVHKKFDKIKFWS